MARYPHIPSRTERARRSGTLLFGAVALIALALAELFLQSIPELGPLIAAVYAMIIITSAAVARAFAKLYLNSISPLFGLPSVVAVPVYSFGLGFMVPVLFFTMIGEIGLVYIVILTAYAASPTIVVGGALATILMKRWYGQND